MSPMNSALKILICDADEGTREALKIILGDHYNLILTNSPEQCLDCLKNAQDIKLLLLGKMLCVVNGLSMPDMIKEIAPPIKVFLLPGPKAIEAETAVIPTGISGYIGKPFNGDKILKMIKEA